MQSRMSLILPMGAAILLASCQGAAPSASGVPGSPVKPSAGQPADAGSQPVQDAVPASPQPAPGSTSAAPPPPAAAPEARPEAAVKRYKMNPRTYDIQPVEGSGAPAKAVLLTFDDGPKDRDVLESLLGTLKRHKAKAIFFVNGYRVRQKPELLKLIHEQGHTVGNHSWDHIDLAKESADSVKRQIGDVQKEVEALTGEAPRFFRPPFGSGGEAVRAEAKTQELLYMTWSNGSKDWEMTTQKNDPQKVVTNVLEQLRPGSNILMHELPWTAEALDTLLTRLAGQGYHFADPAELLSE
ncbi:peptidoglycan/xylan/chitin deacetylase (PgdA/CDA1 family) [Paenibacillus mucilaginosus]|uniref:polysaccharide deacetylase family protein n=1 Tax=Paenibacillus mucilaginosus TaxID=61624 RepID=UPI003D20286F